MGTEMVWLRNANTFGMTWFWVNDDRILIFGCTITLKPQNLFNKTYKCLCQQNSQHNIQQKHNIRAACFYI